MHSTTNTTTHARVPIQTKLSTRRAVVVGAVGAFVVVGLVCVMVIMHRRMKKNQKSLEEIHAKLETLTRVAESDGETLMDEALPVEECEETEDDDDIPLLETLLEEEDHEEEEDDDDFNDNVPRVEELPSPALRSKPPRTSRKKPPKKSTAVVFDLDLLDDGNDDDVTSL